MAENLRYLSVDSMIPVIDLIGKPFQDGGRGPETFDCWGLCLEVFRREGVMLRDYRLCCYDAEGFDRNFRDELPRWNRYQWPDIPVPAVITIRFNEPVVNHVGVYIGDMKFLHTREKTGVVVERIDAPYWKHRIEGFYTPNEPR